MITGGIAEQYQRAGHEHGARPFEPGAMSEADQHDARGKSQGSGDGVDPATQERLWPAMHVESDFAFDFGGDDAFDFCGMASPLAMARLAFASALRRMFSALLCAFTRMVSAFACRACSRASAMTARFASISAFVGFAIGCLHYKLRNRNLR